MKFWKVHFFSRKHFLTSPHEYARGKFGDVTPSQFIMNIEQEISFFIEEKR